MFSRPIKEIRRLLRKGMSNVSLNNSHCKKANVSKLWIPNFKKFVSRSGFGEFQLTQITKDFKTSCWNLKIEGLGKNSYDAFFYLCFVLEIFYFKQNGNPFSHVKRHYWIKLIIEKESPIFLTQFLTHLWILPENLYLSLKNIYYWIWSSQKFILRDKLTSGYFKSTFLLCSYWPIQC